MFGSRKQKAIIISVIVLLILALFAYLKLIRDEVENVAPVVVSPEKIKSELIGKSVEGRPIEAYYFGEGGKKILLVGGIHGGYEWNSVALAYQFIDYFTSMPDQIPKGVQVAIIPSLNPDGVFAVVRKEGRFTIADATMSTSTAVGRFNARSVDLNRNFDCKWKPESMWRGNRVSAGSAVFSEPEAAALRDFVVKFKPGVAVFWHSQANAVYASACLNGILPETLSVMNAYSIASGYSAVKTFDAYEVTGAAEDWLASIGISAVTVELKTHEDVEWAKNLAGVNALFNLYRQP